MASFHVTDIRKWSLNCPLCLPVPFIFCDLLVLEFLFLYHPGTYIKKEHRIKIYWLRYSYKFLLFITPFGCLFENHWFQLLFIQYFPLHHLLCFLASSIIVWDFSPKFPNHTPQILTLAFFLSGMEKCNTFISILVAQCNPASSRVVLNSFVVLPEVVTMCSLLQQWIFVFF